MPDRLSISEVRTNSSKLLEVETVSLVDVLDAKELAACMAIELSDDWLDFEQPDDIRTATDREIIVCILSFCITDPTSIIVVQVRWKLPINENLSRFVCLHIIGQFGGDRNQQPGLVIGFSDLDV